VATADRTYADPSVLLKLYIHESASASVSRWRARLKGGLPLTLHGRLDIVNGICLAASRKAVSLEAMDDALASFGEDLSDGRDVSDSGTFCSGRAPYGINSATGSLIPTSNVASVIPAAAASWTR
jgi:hypothetical protein